MSENQKIGVVAVIIIGILVTFGNFYYRIGPAKQAEQSYQNQQKKFEKQLEESKEEFRIIESMLNDEKRYNELKEMVELARKRLPSTEDASGFLQAIITVLAATGMHGESVGVMKTLTDSEQYKEIPYKIKAQGRYHELGQALTLIEQNPDRFMRVKNFALSNSIDRPSIHPIDMEIATFVFLQH